MKFFEQNFDPKIRLKNMQSKIKVTILIRSAQQISTQNKSAGTYFCSVVWGQGTELHTHNFEIWAPSRVLLKILMMTL
jgi:hypothetical protein